MAAKRTLSLHARRVGSRSSAHRPGRGGRSVCGRKRRGRLHRGGRGLLGVREPAHRPGRRRLPARALRRERAHAAPRLLRRAPGAERPRRTSSSGSSSTTATRSRSSTPARCRSAVPGAVTRAMGGASPLGIRAVGGAARSRGETGARGRRPQRGAGVSPPDPRSAAALLPRGRRALRAGSRARGGRALRRTRSWRTRSTRLAVEGADCFYRGELAERIAAHVPITLDDLARYEVIEREPLAVSYRGERAPHEPAALERRPPARWSASRRSATRRPRPLGDRPRDGGAGRDAAPRRSAARRTSAPSTATATRRRSRARSARRAASSSRAPASSSTTCSERRTSSARFARGRG